MSAARFHIYRIPYSIRSRMNESYWVHAFLDSRNLLIAALLAAVSCLCISYPGNLYSDSYGRIELAMQLPDIIRGAFGGSPAGISSWNTVTPCYFIALFHALTGNIAAYTFAQAFFFFYSTLLLIRKMTASYRVLSYLLYLLNPLFFCVSIYHETGIGVVIGLVSLILLLNLDGRDFGPGDTVMAGLLILLAAFVAFGYRANTFTVLPALLLILFLRKELPFIRRILYTGCLTGGLLLTVLIPKILRIDTMSSVSLGFVWEMGENIASMPDEKQEQYKDWLDGLFGEGATGRLCDWAGCPDDDGGGKARPIRRVASFSWEVADFSREAISEAGLGRIFGRYLALYARSPASSIRTKLAFAGYALGIHPGLHLKEWEYDRWERGKEFGMSDSRMRHRFTRAYRIAVEKTCIPLRPWLVLLIALLLVFLKIKATGQSLRQSIECQLILISVFYYGAFLLNTQSMEFRYFYPAFYLLSLTVISSITALLPLPARTEPHRGRP